MPVTPAWLAATSGQAGLAGQVNQFLGSHAATFLYAGAQTASVVTSGSADTSTNGLYLAQSWTTGAGQTELGYVTVPVSTTTPSGANLAPTALSLYASSGGGPSGPALVTCEVTAEYAYLATGDGNPNVFAVYPLPAAGLTASTGYWLVLAAAGGAPHNYTWYRSASSSSASTSPDGATWTAQSYGFRFAAYDQTPAGLLTAIWEDSGARWTTLTWSGGQPATLAEYTAGQTAAGYQQSYRSLTCTGGLLTGVA